MKYPKINTLWKRNLDTGIIQPNNYSKKEFKNIKYWHITEKIDGMNIRIIYDKRPGMYNTLTGANIQFKGRTDKAILPEELKKYLEVVFTEEIFKLYFPKHNYICLYGEGYGHKIQKGGHQYTPFQEFILFDIFVDGWWLQQKDVTHIANYFNIQRVPILGIWTKERAIDFIDPNVNIFKTRFDTFVNIDNIPLSIIAKEPKKIEGIMCRSEPLMLFRNKSPIIFKLKVEDYVEYTK